MTTRGLDSWTRKVLALPDVVAKAAAKANNDNALDFMQQAAARIPKSSSDDHEGARAEHLINSLQKTSGGGPGWSGDGQRQTGLAVTVSIGGPEAPYPMHLEGGHMAKNGKHVPGKPFWFPTIRVNKRKWKARRSSTVRAAIKSLIGAGGG
jgi:hypothetical protein